MITVEERNKRIKVCFDALTKGQQKGVKNSPPPKTVFGLKLSSSGMKRKPDERARMRAKEKEDLYNKAIQKLLGENQML